MSKRVEYYNAPIELWQGFLDKPKDVLEDVLDYVSAEYDTEDEAASVLCVSYGSWDRAYEHGKELRECKEYSGVLFSISRTKYWFFHDHKTSKDENLLLLAYLALNSIGGRGRISFTNSAFMFCRMAGYGRMYELQKYKYNPKTKKWNVTPTPTIFEYMKNPAMMGYYCEKLRYALMSAEEYPDFTCYSEKGKRGFAFTFDNEKSKDELWREMRDAMRINSTSAKHNELKERMKQAVQK